MSGQLLHYRQKRDVRPTPNPQVVHPPAATGDLSSVNRLLTVLRVGLLLLFVTILWYNLSLSVFRPVAGAPSVRVDRETSCAGLPVFHERPVTGNGAS
jgi:hypothetical protein